MELGRPLAVVLVSTLMLHLAAGQTDQAGTPTSAPNTTPAAAEESDSVMLVAVCVGGGSFIILLALVVACCCSCSFKPKSSRERDVKELGESDRNPVDAFYHGAPSSNDVTLRVYPTNSSTPAPSGNPLSHGGDNHAQATMEYEPESSASLRNTAKDGGSSKSGSYASLAPHDDAISPEEYPPSPGSSVDNHVVVIGGNQKVSVGQSNSAYTEIPAVQSSIAIDRYQDWDSTTALDSTAGTDGMARTTPADSQVTTTHAPLANRYSTDSIDWNRSVDQLFEFIDSDRYSSDGESM